MNAPASSSLGKAMISVQTVLQDSAAAVGSAVPGGNGASNATPPPMTHPIMRQQHRLAAGMSIRQLLCQAGLEAAITRINSGELGLSCHGKRAWLDDILADGSRVEMVEPIQADAKAQRARRVAEDRRRRSARFGGRG